MMNKDYNIDLLKVIADFLELGHVENIVAMFKQDTSLYNMTGNLVRDERFAVIKGRGSYHTGYNRHKDCPETPAAACR